MLPIFRIISVGGVILAIAILILALIPPGGSHLVLAQHEVVARGALVDPGRHPEWRQFLIQAAFLRADELERLRRLPDIVISRPALEAYGGEVLDRALIEALNKAAPIDPTAPKFASLPVAEEAEPEDVTGSIGDDPGASMPIDIGAASSTELPVTATDELPPAVRLPALQIPETENLPLPPARPPAAGETMNRPQAPRRVVQQRTRRAVATAPAAAPVQVPPPFNILAAIFESLSAPRPPAPPASQTAAPPPVSRQALATRAVTQ